MASDRFVCMPDPCDLWTVWDQWNGAPAQKSGAYLVGLTQADAIAQCAILNTNMFGVSTEADASRPTLGER